MVDVDEIAAKLTPKTKLIVITNMHNPSGVLTANEVLIEIGKLARKVGAYVLVDEVYLDFLFEDRPKSAVHLGPNFMITSSLTKAYGLDGLRCGWILASPKHAETIWRLQDFFGVNGTIPAEKASTAAFEHLDRFAERTRSILAANRPLVDKFLESHKDKLKWVTPNGGPVAFPRMLGVKDTRGFAAELKLKYHTTIIPGYFFEMPQHFRLGMGGPTETLRAGLRQLSKALNG
jgi:aspartate/methionine/tyrosine aminotransferase